MSYPSLVRCHHPHILWWDWLIVCVRPSVRPSVRQDCARVQALIIVFSRLVDVDNFGEVVLGAVRIEEKRELEHRLGILNVLNPVRVSQDGLPSDR